MKLSFLLAKEDVHLLVTHYQENGCNGVEDCIVRKKGIREIPKCHEENNYKRKNQCSFSLGRNLSSPARVKFPVKIHEQGKMLWRNKRNTKSRWTKRHEVTFHNDNSGVDEGGYFERNIIPLHEFIAMQLARSEIT